MALQQPVIGTRDDLLNAVRLERHRMPIRMREIADALLADPDRFAVNSNKELAEGLGVVPSALIRFAKLLSFSGMSALQRVLRQPTAMGGRGYRERTRELARARPEMEVDLEHITAAVVASNVAALEQVMKTVDLASLAGTLNALRQARMIGIAAQKRALPVAQYFYYGLSRLDLKPLLLDGAGGMMDAQAGVLSARDALVVVTFAPYAETTLAVAKSARARGCTVIALTDSKKSPVIPLADHSIIVAEADLNQVRSISVSSAILQSMFFALGLDVGAGRGKNSNKA